MCNWASGIIKKKYCLVTVIQQKKKLKLGHLAIPNAQSELVTFTQKSGLSPLIRDNWQPYVAVDIYSLSFLKIQNIA